MVCVLLAILLSYILIFVVVWVSISYVELLITYRGSIIVRQTYENGFLLCQFLKLYSLETQCMLQSYLNQVCETGRIKAFQVWRVSQVFKVLLVRETMSIILKCDNSYRWGINNNGHYYKHDLSDWYRCIQLESFGFWIEQFIQTLWTWAHYFHVLL